MGKKKDEKRQRKRIEKVLNSGASVAVKGKCCKKFKKGEAKRCKNCPCFDLLKKVA
jgi:hypothetical protein